MTTTTIRAAQLDRAYVRSKVIEANLEYLRIALLGENREFTDRLRPIADGFGQYVRLLGDASALADTPGRAVA